MKIVLPVHHFPPGYSAGAELYTLRLARWLIEHGQQVDVVAIERTDADSPEPRATHDHFQGVPVWRLSLNCQPASDSLRWSYDNPHIGHWFATYLRRARPDLVHVQGGYLLTASVLETAFAQQIATVLTLHDYWFLCPRLTLQRGDGSICAHPPTDPAACAWCVRLERRRYRLADRLSGGMLGYGFRALAMEGPRAAMAARRSHLRATLARVNAIVAPSQFMATLCAGYGRPGQTSVVRIGVDRDALVATPPPPNDGVLRVGYTGQIAPHKGVDLLVSALQRLPERGCPVELRIYGDMSRHQAYSAMLRKRIGGDTRVRLGGRYEHSWLPAILAECSVVAVPSIWYENCPLAILEAHAAGRPVIASAMGGMAELVRHEVDGLQFRPGDPTDLARQIQRLRDEPGLLPKLRAGIVPPAPIDDEMATLMTIYRRVVQQAASRAGTPGR